MKFLAKLSTLLAGLCLGYIFSGVMGLLVSRGDAIKVLVAAAVIVAVCSLVSGFAPKKTSRKRW